MEVYGNRGRRSTPLIRSIVGVEVFHLSQGWGFGMIRWGERVFGIDFENEGLFSGKQRSLKEAL